MAFSHGSDAFLSWDGTDISQYLNSAARPQTADVAEVSAFGDTDKAYIPGLKDGTVSLEGHFDPVVDALLDGDLGGAAVPVIYGPQGNASGAVRYTFNAILTAYDPPASTDDRASFTAEAQKTGAHTRDTFP